MVFSIDFCKVGIVIELDGKIKGGLEFGKVFVIEKEFKECNGSNGLFLWIVIKGKVYDVFYFGEEYFGGSIIFIYLG